MHRAQQCVKWFVWLREPGIFSLLSWFLVVQMTLNQKLGRCHIAARAEEVVVAAGPLEPPATAVPAGRTLEFTDWALAAAAGDPTLTAADRAIADATAFLHSQLADLDNDGAAATSLSGWWLNFGAPCIEHGRYLELSPKRRLQPPQNFGGQHRRAWWVDVGPSQCACQYQFAPQRWNITGM
jgi:hypothetical protein